MNSTEAQQFRKFADLLEKINSPETTVEEGIFSSHKNEDGYGRPQVDLDTALRLMKKYNMVISSFGTGLGIEFNDNSGKRRYEESSNKNGRGSNTDSMSIEAMVSFALDEIGYWDSAEELSSHEDFSPPPQR